MTKRVMLQPAFVLHKRAYRDTSLIVDLFTMHYGRVSAVARGARGMRSRYRGILEPFRPLLVSWSGRNELVNLSQVEPSGAPIDLIGRGLLSAFYVNELLVRLLQREDDYPELFMHYQKVLAGLQKKSAPEISLRLFEKDLLGELGYGFPFSCEYLTGAELQAEIYYRFEPQCGFILSNADSDGVFLGEHLLALKNNCLESADVLKSAKRLMRAALNPLLGHRPLKTRELFV